MKKLSLKAKLWINCGALLLILLLVGGMALKTALTTQTLAGTVKFNTQKQHLGGEMQLAIEKEKVGGRDALLHDDSKYLTAARVEFQQKSDELQPLLTTPTSHQLFAAIQEQNARYDGFVDQALQKQQSGDHAGALEIFYGEGAKQAKLDLKKSTDDLMSWYGNLADKASKDQIAGNKSAVSIIPIMTALGFAIGIGIAIFVIRSLVTSITQIVSVVEAISQHNLCIPDVEVTTNDELGQAGRALNTMKANLSRMVRSITQSAEQLAGATEEISQGAKQNSSSAHGEAEQAVQVASAMQEMTATVREVADHAEHASVASKQSATSARKGGEIADETLITMNSIATSTSNAASRILELGKSSEKIGNIVAVITEIAGQTNLLALNAAIEAARAGEQGRGFAVVAGEVRRLAERTASATKEIAGMIQTIQTETKVAVSAIEEGQREVEVGVKKTSETGQALKEIIGMSDQVGSMVAQIASAASEQNGAAEQISSSISQISGLTQTSSANADQTAAACGHLSELASELHHLVNEFCVGEATDSVGGRPTGARPGAAGRVQPINRPKPRAA
ncbi:methyl-accepting chemotaxis protein [Bradyrhizobium sp.]|uniref:methyl-accepting chemotaxis protein n=1 Tax=Bradyrhizobium sp. TaxID=376 RepID=UPI003C38D31E